MAGIFDGEGFLGPASRGTYYRLTVAQLAETKLLSWLRDTLGCGRVNVAKNGAPSGAMGQFHLESQRQIYEFCYGVLPYVMVKRARVVQVIADCEQRYGLAADPTACGGW
jgi:hypothetical protein